MALPQAISRRSFLSLAAVSAGGMLLAACGGAGPAPSATAPSVSASTPKPAASAAAAAKPSVGAQGGEPSIKVAFPVITGAQTPLWLAESLDLFEQQHVKESSQLIATSVAVQAIVAKDVDVILQAAAAVITADLNGGADLVYVGSEYNHSQEALVVAPAIKTAADLKGKVWGTDRPGSTGDYQTRLLLRLIGLQPSEVELRVLGTQDVLVAALTSGQIQAAPVAVPGVFQLEAAGFHVLRDTWDQPYQNVGAVVSRARIPELTPALIPFLKAYRQGMQAYAQQPDAAKNILKEKAKITDQSSLDKSYEFYVKQTQFQTDLQPTTEGIQHMLDFLSASIPAAKTAKPEQFVDLRLLDELGKA
ncbi:MAG TPA: ABC transporter substrate-binding protein [Chloroflexota bacterium]|nr:ABC transporter substrate-binding protein [Chloroflexota bacterium]